MASFDKELGLLREHLKKARLKQSLQRESVLKALLDGPKYVTLDELTRRAQARDKSIGRTGQGTQIPLRPYLL
jgi:Fe2+ or Zn2+ uptake regulation protein